MAVNNLKLNKKDIEKFVLYGGYKAKTAQAVVNELKEKPDYIINAGHFQNSVLAKDYGLTITDAIVDNKFINGGNYNEIYENQGFAWNTINDMSFVTTYYTKQMEKDWKYYMAGSPCLIKNGVFNENKYLNSTFAKRLTRRIGMGVSDNAIYFSFPTNDTTAKTVANSLKSYGCKNAILLDGGGSQCVGKVVNGKVTHLDNNKKNRAVSTWFLIYLKKQKPTFPKVYEVVNCTSLNMRTKPDVASAIYKPASFPNGKLPKGSRITVFEIVYNEKEKRYWAKSYGYYVAMEYLKEV